MRKLRAASASLPVERTTPPCQAPLGRGELTTVSARRGMQPGELTIEYARLLELTVRQPVFGTCCSAQSSDDEL